MTQWQVIALIGGGFLAIFKGKDVWDFLKHVFDCKKKDERILELEKRLAECEKKFKASEKSNTRLKKLLK